MKIRILDRILVALAGLLLIASAAALVAQVVFQVDVAGFATRVVSSDSLGRRLLLITAAVLLLLLGGYCLAVLFRHRRRKDRFVTQKTENGDLSISMKALMRMVDRCLEQHPEVKSQEVSLENQREGLLVKIRGDVAGGISIPLTIEALQRQIKQYVTACSGVEVKGVRVQIEATGEDAQDAVFSIAPPTAKPLLHEPEKMPLPEPEAHVQAMPEEPAPEEKPAEVPEEPAAVSAVPPMDYEPDEDDRPMHQRIFSTEPEPCVIPMPPEGAAGEETPEATAEEIPTAEEASSEEAPAAEEAPAEAVPVMDEPEGFAEEEAPETLAEEEDMPSEPAQEDVPEAEMKAEDGTEWNGGQDETV